MRKIVFTIVFLCLVIVLVAQTKSQRRIYLWDVTLSMKGYRGVANHPYQRELDIYNDVRDFLVNDIGKFDENTEIVIIPFQDERLSFDTWIVQADENGKQKIIDKIVNYKNDVSTLTDIVRTIEFAKNSVIKNDKANTLILLTDGTQSKECSGGNEALIKLVKGWQAYAKINNAYMFYIMLNDKAVPDKQLFETLKEEEKTKTLSVVSDFIILEPSLNNFNLKADKGKPVAIALNCKSGNVSAMSANIKVKVTAKNEYFNIDEIQTVDVKNMQIVFNLNYEDDLIKTLTDRQITKIEIPLQIDLLNQEMLQKDGKTVTISPNDISLVLINKLVKTLKINYVQK